MNISQDYRSRDSFLTQSVGQVIKGKNRKFLTTAEFPDNLHLLPAFVVLYMVTTTSIKDDQAVLCAFTVINIWTQIFVYMIPVQCKIYNIFIYYASTNNENELPL